MAPDSKRTHYERKARNQPIVRYQIEHKTPPIKIRKDLHNTKEVSTTSKVEKHPVIIQDTWQQIGQKVVSKDFELV